EAETEVLGWVMASLEENGLTTADRWHELRGRVGESTLNPLFYSYLGQCTRQPREPEHYADFADTAEERGWCLSPAGYASMEAYWQDYPQRRPSDNLLFLQY